jgi:hypothetical protein
MDTVGLLAAWTGIISLLSAVVIAAAVYVTTALFQRWWAATSPARAARRIEKLSADLAMLQAPDSAYLADLISLYGALIVTLIAGTALVIVYILVLDLGPALLAAILPFNINATVLTRITGLFLLFGSVVFVFRMSYLVVQLRLRTFPRRARYVRIALREIARMRQVQAAHTERVVG